MSLAASYLAIVVILVVAAFAKGCSYGQEESVKELAAHESRAREEIRARDDEITAWKVSSDIRGQELEKALKQKRVEIRTVEKEVIREVNKYVTADSGHLPNGWVYLYNLSLQGAAPADPPGFAVGEKSDTSLHEGARIAAQNNLACKADRERLEAWQEWYRGELEKW